jgi:hypothetical protein
VLRPLHMPWEQAAWLMPCACTPCGLQVKLAISHALAQSTKLCVYEERVVETVLETKHLPETLAKHGNVHISRKKVAQLIGAQHADCSSWVAGLV